MKSNKNYPSKMNTDKTIYPINNHYSKVVKWPDIVAYYDATTASSMEAFFFHNPGRGQGLVCACLIRP